MKYITISLLLFSITSCSKSSLPTYTRSNVATVTTTTKDCSGYESEMKLLYGYDSPNSGATFARILAVDHQDGTMSIAILPPEGYTEFSFPEFILQHSLKLIACPENGISAALSPTSVNTACKSAPVNVIGGIELNPDSNFTSKGVYINGSRVHATRNPGTDEGKLVPNFIMLVTTKTDENNDKYSNKIIAAGELPYKSCYSSN